MSQSEHPSPGFQQPRLPVLIKVPTLDILPTDSSVHKTFALWERQIKSYVAAAVAQNAGVDKLALLCGFISADVYSMIEEQNTYDEAFKRLQELYKPRKNIVFARHQLSTRNQASGESVQAFYQNLLTLTKDCDFKAVSAEEHKEEAVRDSFIRGLNSSSIRTRLLEQDDLTLQQALKTAVSLEKAQEFSSTYLSTDIGAHSVRVKEPEYQNTSVSPRSKSTPCSSICPKLPNADKIIKNCRYCGGSHSAKREACPASTAFCYHCKKLGHYKKFCRSRIDISRTSTTSDYSSPSVSFVAGVLSSLQYTSVPITVMDRNFQALMDSGAGQSFMKSSVASILGFLPEGPDYTINLASEKCSARVLGSVDVKFRVSSQDYSLRFGIVDELCTDFYSGS